MTTRVDFNIIPGPAVLRILAEDPQLPMESVKQAYLAHHRGETENPDSHFLRYKDRPKDRIIALLAALNEPPVAGAKLVASSPGNIARNEPRASAVVVLHDLITGRPRTLLEGAKISASRTAASAVLGAQHLNPTGKSAGRAAFVGAGVINAEILALFQSAGWRFGQVGVYDLDAASADAFARRGAQTGQAVARLDSLEEAVTADLVILATSAITPYIQPPAAFRPGQLILNISLRDIAPELILGASNYVDDVDHCLKANTSPHLAEQQAGDRSFITGTLAAVLAGEIEPSAEKPIIFSPFGMGILDLRLAAAIEERALAAGLALPIENFFGDAQRWG